VSDKPTRPASTQDPDYAPVYDWLIANGVEEWLPEYPAITVDRQARTITYTAFVWDGPRGWDGEHLLILDDEVASERRTVPLAVEPDERVTLRLAHMRHRSDTVGCVEKQMFVEVDGAEIPVGMVSVPVMLAAPADTTRRVQDVYVRVDAGPAEVKIDGPPHADCPGDLTFAAYVRTGADRTHIGELTCCTECVRPTLTPV
jgi:hypothetical protein